MICKKCGKTIDDNSVFCQYCGTKVESKKKCFNCGTELDDDAVFCYSCGTRVSDETAIENSDTAENDNRQEKSKPRKAKEKYLRVEKILNPSLLLFLIFGLFICSFFIGFGFKTGGSSTVSYYGNTSNMFWVFGDNFRKAEEIVSSTHCLAQNVGLLKFVAYLPAVVCLIAVILNFVSVITCFIIAIVRFVSSFSDEKKGKTPKINNLAVISSLSFLLAVFFMLGRFYIDTSVDKDYLHTTMSAGSIVGICFICVVFVTSFVLGCVGQGRALLTKSKMTVVVCGILFVIVSFIVLALTNILFYEFEIESGVAEVSKTSPPMWLNAVFMQYIDSDASGALGLRISSMINFFSYVIFIVSVCLLLLFIIKSFFSAKSKVVPIIVFSILTAVSSLAMLITAIITNNSFMGLNPDSEIVLTVPILIFVFSIVLLVLSIISVNVIKKRKATELPFPE